MPRKYPGEFRARAVSLVRSAQMVSKTAADLGVTARCLHGCDSWGRQVRIRHESVCGFIDLKAGSR